MISIKLPGTHTLVQWPTTYTPPKASETLPPAPPPPQQQQPTAAAVGALVGGLQDEAVRRNRIVMNLYNSCNIRPGDTVFPTEQFKEQLGDKLIVVAIAKTYAELGRDVEWPKSDNPMMVHVKNDKDFNYFVTVNSLSKRKA